MMQFDELAAIQGGLQCAFDLNTRWTYHHWHQLTMMPHHCDTRSWLWHPRLHRFWYLGTDPDTMSKHNTEGARCAWVRLHYAVSPATGGAGGTLRIKKNPTIELDKLMIIRE